MTKTGRSGQPPPKRKDVSAGHESHKCRAISDADVHKPKKEHWKGKKVMVTDESGISHSCTVKNLKLDRNQWYYQLMEGEDLYHKGDWFLESIVISNE